MFRCLLFIAALLLSLFIAANAVARPMQVVVMDGLPDVGVSFIGQEAGLQGRKSLRLGVSGEGYEPLIFVQGQRVRGMAFDYMSMIAASLDVPIEVRRYADWNSTIRALKSGEIDVLATGTAAEARIGGLLLTVPYVSNRPVLVARDNSKFKGQPSSLVGGLAVLDGFIPVDEVSLRYPAARVERFPTVKAALHSVEYGGNEWMIGDAVTVAYNLYGGELPGLRVRHLDGWQAQGYSFVFRATDLQLQQAFNRVLAQIPQLTHSDIMRYWGVTASSGLARVEYTEAERRWLKSAPTINVAMSSATPPYSFYGDDGKIQGILPDLLDEISLRTGLSFSMIGYEAASDLLASLRQGGGRI